jgi:hypothetical protein
MSWQHDCRASQRTCRDEFTSCNHVILDQSVTSQVD